MLRRADALWQGTSHRLRPCTLAPCTWLHVGLLFQFPCRIHAPLSTTSFCSSWIGLSIHVTATAMAEINVEQRQREKCPSSAPGVRIKPFNDSSSARNLFSLALDDFFFWREAPITLLSFSLWLKEVHCEVAQSRHPMILGSSSSSGLLCIWSDIYYIRTPTQPEKCAFGRQAPIYRARNCLVHIACWPQEWFLTQQEYNTIPSLMMKASLGKNLLVQRPRNDKSMYVGLFQLFQWQWRDEPATFHGRRWSIKRLREWLREGLHMPTHGSCCDWKLLVITHISSICSENPRTSPMPECPHFRNMQELMIIWFIAL